MLLVCLIFLSMSLSLSVEWKFAKNIDRDSVTVCWASSSCDYPQLATVADTTRASHNSLCNSYHDGITRASCAVSSSYPQLSILCPSHRSFSKISSELQSKGSSVRFRWRSCSVHRACFALLFRDDDSCISIGSAYANVPIFCPA